MRVLIIGLGIGQVYLEQCQKRGFETFTLDSDPTKLPTFSNLTEAKSLLYDIVIICTPNYTHEFFIKQFCKNTDFLLVEKPGLANKFVWEELAKEIAPTKMVMVKNNLYRDFSGLKMTLPAKKINIMWINANRIPGPGTWFTTKNKAWGGVSYDLMPHLLHMMLGLDLSFVTPMQSLSFQKYSLQEVVTTDYGSVNEKGVYDVDDHCFMSYFGSFGTTINLIAAWKTDEIEKSKMEVHVHSLDGKTYGSKFGLCPNAVYGKMLDQMIAQKKEDSNFYKKHMTIDTWILEQISNVNTQRFRIRDIIK